PPPTIPDAQAPTSPALYSLPIPDAQAPTGPALHPPLPPNPPVSSPTPPPKKRRFLISIFLVISFLVGIGAGGFGVIGISHSPLVAKYQFLGGLIARYQYVGGLDLVGYCQSLHYNSAGHKDVNNPTADDWQCISPLREEIDKTQACD